MINLLDEDMIVNERLGGLTHTHSSETKLAQALLHLELQEAGDDKKLAHLAYLKFMSNGNLPTFFFYKSMCERLGLDIQGNPLVEGKSKEKILFYPAYSCRGRDFEETYI